MLIPFFVLFRPGSGKGAGDAPGRERVREGDIANGAAAVETTRLPLSPSRKGRGDVSGARDPWQNLPSLTSVISGTWFLC